MNGYQGHDFSGIRALVTGAASGIGRETAACFASHGAEVIGTDIDEMRPESVGKEAPGEKIKFIRGDITDREFVKELVDRAGDVDVLVNCAGWVRHEPFLESDPSDWEKVYAVNVLALLRLTQLVARRMVARKIGHIVNISSILARRVYPYTLAYAGTKHAVRAISEGLRMELQHSGIKVTEIAPGLTDTAIFRDIRHAAVIEAYSRFQCEKLHPAEIARAVMFCVAAPPGSCPDVVSVIPLGQA